MSRVAFAAMAAGLGHDAGSQATPALWALAVLVCAPLGRAGKLLENRLDALMVRNHAADKILVGIAGKFDGHVLVHLGVDGFERRCR